MTVATKGSEIDPPKTTAPKDLVSDDFQTIELEDGDLSDQETWRRQCLDEARAFAAHGADRSKILEFLKIEFHRANRPPQAWMREYYKIAAEAVAIAIRESAEAAGIKPDADAPTAISFEEKWFRLFGQSFLGINKVTALQFQAAIAAPVLMK